jgi:hypothetical protein
MDDDLPRDPDEDDLPDIIRVHQGPYFIEGIDPDTGELIREPVSRQQLATAFATRRRVAEPDDAA